MVKAKKKGASKPMGAGRTETMGTGGTATSTGPSAYGIHHGEMSAKDKIKALKSMALKVVPKPQRKAFIAQGMQAIEKSEAEREMSAKVKAFYADTQPVLDKHGVFGFHILVKVPVDAKAKEMGIKGWSLTSDVLAVDGLEMMGVLSQSLINLSSTNFRSVKA